MSTKKDTKNSLSNPEVFQEFKQDYLSWCFHSYYRRQQKLQSDFILNQKKNADAYFEAHAQLSFDFSFEG